MSMAGPRAAVANHRENLAARTAPDSSAVRLSDVSKVYGRGGDALLALDRVSLSAAPGEFVCLLGRLGLRQEHLALRGYRPGRGVGWHGRGARARAR